MRAAAILLIAILAVTLIAGCINTAKVEVSENQKIIENVTGEIEEIINETNREIAELEEITGNLTP